jgi:hypothetical protein
MVVPEPAVGAREGRWDAPGRGEGEGSVASEISRLSLHRHAHQGVRR